MDKKEVEEYLARIRKTVAESENAIMEANLRIQETDRFLARQGLTRDQVMSWHPTKEQRLVVNEELRRRGLPALEEDDAFDVPRVSEVESLASGSSAGFGPGPSAGFDAEGSAISDRQAKFNMFMREFRL